MTLDEATFRRALLARDARFDGLFFVGVTTTGIYCRPICPARTPRVDRTRFFLRAAEAERAGFRACFRCRPEIAPGLAPIDAPSRLAAAAAARIGTREESLDAAAEALGVSARHLRRVVADELGVSPVELLQSRRLAIAKQLLQDTALPLASVAFAAGFSSIRRFNASFRARFGRPPSALRRETPEPSSERGRVCLRLDARAPFAWDSLLAFLASRAIPGVEHVDDRSYRRTVRIGGHRGVMAARAASRGTGVELSLSPSLLPVLSEVVARVRRLFDLDARPDAIAACLARAPMLRASVERSPGLRLPGAFDGFEMAVRAVLGQQISVKGATTLAGRVVRAFGEPLDAALTEGEPSLAWLFPPPPAWTQRGAAGVAAIGMPRRRADALVGLAEAVQNGRVSLDAVPIDPEATMGALAALPGLGPWTAHYVGMRALAWPDAFPAEDLVLRRRLGDGSSARARERVACVRPYRAYAAIHAWSGAGEEREHE